MSISVNTAAKEAQEYEAKPEFPMCSNCKHFTSDKKVIKGTFGDYIDEKKLRCGIGGFAVKKQGTCKMHTPAIHPGSI